MLTPEELEKEWMAQSAISDYRNWLEDQVIKLRQPNPLVEAVMKAAKLICTFQLGIGVEELFDAIAAYEEAQKGKK